MFKRSFIISFLIIFSYNALFSQENTLKFNQRLSISEGLSHNGVTSILEDSRGFLWVGTYDGLNKYNGYDFKVFRNTIDSDILVSNRVRTLSEDKKGVIWIGTDEGITTYDFSKETFKNLYDNKNANRPLIRRIIIGKKNGLVLCATESNGILVFNDDYNFKGQYLPSSEFSPKRISFFDGMELDDSNYMFTTSAGLIIFNVENETFKRVLPDEIGFCNYIIKVDSNTFFVTLETGVAVFDMKAEGNNYTFKFKKSEFQDIQFNSAAVDELGNLWLNAIRDGLFHIDNAKAFVNNQPYKQSTYQANTGLLRLSSVFTSSSSGCWIGSFNKGLFHFNLKENPFKHYATEMNYKNGLVSNEVLHINALDAKRIFVTANRGGLALFNTENEQFETLYPKIIDQNARGAGSVFIDSKNNIWLKVIGKGFGRIVANTNSFEVVESAELGLNIDFSPRTFTEDKKGNLWIASEKEVFKLSLEKNGKISKIERLNNNPFFKNNSLNLVRYIYADPQFNFIWIGTDANGLYRVNIEFEGAIEELVIDQFLNDKNNKLSLSSNFVTSIVRLPNKELWIGTERGGICKVVRSDGIPDFISFSEKQGLSNNVVKSLLYDDEYNLWVTTNIGLNKFNTKDFVFRKFTKENGLPYEDFNYGAAKLKNGYFVISGFNGFCYFKPKELPDDETLPKLEFESFKIFNKTIFPGDTIANRVLLNKQLADGDELHLKYNEDVFSIEVASLHYSTPKSHYLKYQLAPLSDEWIEVPSSQRFISYNGLQPGEYTFKIMASNSLNKWTVPKELKIIIKPPLWKTTQAYFFYVLFAFLIVFVAVYVILRIQSLKHNVEIDQLEINNVKEINAAKLRFFSNISHDIKTPLTLISGPIDVLIDRFKGNFDVNEKLQIVRRQSKKIGELLEQVHDFQKAEANLLKLNFTNFSFNDFVNELITDFDFFAKNDNKKLVVINEPTHIYVSADKNKLEKVFNNLLNNAFKFTKPGDTISLKFYAEGNDLIVLVSDTGKGIDSEDLSHVFERFYQSQKKHGAYVGGSGIGLAFSKRLVEMHYGYISAESTLFEGTTIHVKMPIVQENQDEDIQQESEQRILLAEKEYVHNNSLIEDIKPSSINISGEFSESLIFLAEDNLEMRLFVSGILSKFFKVKTFTNGKECLDALEEEWPDIVISDLLMPELNGLDLCKAIKSDLKTSHIPVVLLTACTTIDHQIQGIKDGADAYIKKPFNIKHLVTSTEALLLNRKQLRERFQIDFPLTFGKSKEKNSNNVFLEKLYNLMEENLDNQDLDMNQFSKELYLNRTHFYQKVKALTNQTPFELLKAYRIKKAAELLINKKLPVNEVYVMIGFKSRTHFSKLFKETYGVTPGKYAAKSISKYS